MMTAISGELGTGKTYFLARQTYQQHLAGCYVATNFDHVCANKIIKNDPKELLELIRQIAVLKQLGGELCDLLPSFKHTGVFIGIDEAHLAFGRESVKADMENIILPFISLARKQDVHIWYTVQDPATIHKTFRRYTQLNIHLRPLFKLYKIKYFPHETKPILRRERRLLIPLIREEHHKLDYENPTFNYKVKRYEDGSSSVHEDATLKEWHIRRNNDPFIHNMFDSNELSGVMVDPDRKEDFALIRDVDYIPPTLWKTRFPTLRKLMPFLKKPSVPVRYKIDGWEMPQLSGVTRKLPKLTQKVEHIDFMEFLQFKGVVPISRQERKRLEHKAKDILKKSEQQTGNVIDVFPSDGLEVMRRKTGFGAMTYKEKKPLAKVPAAPKMLAEDGGSTPPLSKMEETTSSVESSVTPEGMTPLGVTDALAEMNNALRKPYKKRGRKPKTPTFLPDYAIDPALA